jgi:DNA-binding transcriptional regulator LsrR (DeoR family)
MFNDRTEARPSEERSTTEDRQLMGKAARLYYEYDLTHQEIADVVHLSRVKVTRLLQQARKQGVVVIRVNSDASPFLELEIALRTLLNLDEVVVVPPFKDPTKGRQALARAAALHLQRILRDEMVVALSLSQTVTLIPDYVFDPRRVAVTFVAAVGGLRRGLTGMTPNRPIDALAEAFGGVAEHLNAPAIAGSSELARALLDDATISETLRRAAHADVVVMGLGPVTGYVKLAAEGELTPRELEELVDRGAIGDLSAHFFDQAGNVVEHDWNSRVVGLTLDQIKGIPIRIVAAGGVDKIEAITAAVEGHLASVLITDARVATTLLERTTRRRPGGRHGTTVGAIGAPVPADR